MMKLPSMAAALTYSYLIAEMLHLAFGMSKSSAMHVLVLRRDVAGEQNGLNYFSCQQLALLVPPHQ